MPDDDIYYEPVPDAAYGYAAQPMPEQVPEPTPEQAGEPEQHIDEEAEEEAPEKEPLSFERRVIEVQRKLKAPKSQFNSYGGYYYRNCEDILEGLKPLLDESDLLMSIDDEIVFIEGRFYIKATATVHDVHSDKSMVAHAYAREPENRKGSDQSQVTGSCSSYARKFALNALWLIDDTKDADTPPARANKQPPKSGPFVARCKSCGTSYTFESAEQYKQFIANPNCCPNPQWEVA